jgi:hypothetical protein
MVIEGYVYDKIQVNEKLTQIIIKKKHKELFLFQAYVAFGWLINEIEKLDIQKKDKVRIEYHIKSKKWETKYSTNAIIETIIVKERRTAQVHIDYETGEIFND